MALMESKNKYLYATVVIIVNVFFIITMFFIIKGIYGSNKKVNAEVQKNKQKLEVLEDKLKKLKELKVKEEELLVEKDKLLAALPEKKDIPRLFIQFEKMVDTTGSNVSSASGSIASETASVSEEIPGISTYNFDIKATTTTYESFKNIVLNTESALRLLNITGFNVSSKDNNSFDLSFNLKSYGRAEESK